MPSMSESVGSQIVIGEVESFLNGEKRGGRKRLLDKEKYLDAVKRLLTTSDSQLARYLSVGKTTVWNFRTDPRNASVIREANAFLDSFSEKGVTPSNMTWEFFQNLPHIIRWEDAMDRRMVSESKKRGWMRSFFNLCKYLKVLPSKVTADNVPK